tara:strand:+ start:1366 stop:2607 length:1242 start_codon:yes stop_codon:yes gene_type:complete
MEVLIIHDRFEATESIKQVLVDQEVDESQITSASDIRTARSFVRDKSYDLIILDLTVPNVTGRDQPSFAQVETFLREIYEFEDLLAPGDLIGISQEAEALKLMQSGLGLHFMIALTEDLDGNWKSQLGDKIKYSMRSTNSKQLSMARKHGIDVLLVTAMDKEFAPYRTLFGLNDFPLFPGVYSFVFSDKSGTVRNGIAFSVGASGQASAASRTQSLISWFRPRVALMSGYCGGVKGQVQLGDLCFFESTAPWDYGKWSETRDENGNLVSEQFSSRPTALTLNDPQLRNAARHLAESSGDMSWQETEAVNQLAPIPSISPRFRLTQAASGSAVVANDTIISQIVGLNDAIRAVDMESFGFYDACLNTFVAKPRFLCLKAVSDFCNGEKGDDYHSVCSYLSAITVRRLLMERIEF